MNALVWWTVALVAVVDAITLLFNLRKRQHHPAPLKNMTPGFIFEIPDTLQSRTFAARNPQFIAAIPKIFETANKCFGRDPRSKNSLERVCFWLGHTCRQDFLEIVFLAVNGYGAGATKILRSLYERAVTIAYLIQKPDKVERFLQFAAIQENRAMKAALRQMSEDQIDAAMDPENRVAEVHKRYEQYKGTFEATACEVCGVKTPPSWDLDLVSMVRHVGEPSKNVTLRDFVTSVYFPNIEGQKRASTVRGYRAIWESQLKVRCGQLRLREFKTPQAHAVLADIGRANPELTRSSLHNLRSLLSGIFRHAIQQGYLEGANPIREASIPRAPEGRETYAYGLAEVMQMLRLLPDPARTICAVAAFLGLRRAEIRGLEWPDYTGDEIRVLRSVWESVTSEPKTRKSKAGVPVIGPMQHLLDQYRVSRGNPASGPIFATMKGTTPLNLNNVLNRQILPVLNVCVCGKAEDKHEKEDHEYQRSERPQWHGWHAFRRGLATNLHDLGVADKTIQAILRHANVAVTQNSYIKSLDSQSIAAMRQLESLVDVKLLSSENQI